MNQQGATDGGTPNKDNAIAAVVSWGAYLGCSWTWCIGMFLPALLLRDSGIAGYLVFALPNVLGAALMGWVLRSGEQSERMVRANAQAMGWFSIITIAFHVYWIVWLSGFAQRLLPIPDEYLFGAGAVAVAWAIVSGRVIKRGGEAGLGVPLWLGSFALLIASFFAPGTIAPTTAEMIASVNQRSPIETGALWMIPVCVLGFGLCPYLDATFHHARQRLGTPGRGRAGFTLGFGLMFASMIVLTYQYAGVVIAALSGQSDRIVLHPLMGAALLAHVACQWIYTVRVHLARLPMLPGPGPSLQAVYTPAIFAGVAALLAPSLAPHADMLAGEIGYRCFIGFYGLLFPAYVLFRIVRHRRSRTPVPMRWMWLAIGVAAPMFWVGFIEGHPLWLVPGAAVIGSLVFAPGVRAQRAD